MHDTDSDMINMLYFASAYYFSASYTFSGMKWMVIGTFLTDQSNELIFVQECTQKWFEPLVAKKTNSGRPSN